MGVWTLKIFRLSAPSVAFFTNPKRVALPSLLGPPANTALRGGDGASRAAQVPDEAQVLTATRRTRASRAVNELTAELIRVAARFAIPTRTCVLQGTALAVYEVEACGLPQTRLLGTPAVLGPPTKRRAVAPITLPTQARPNTLRISLTQVPDRALGTLRRLAHLTLLGAPMRRGAGACLAVPAGTQTVDISTRRPTRGARPTAALGRPTLAARRLAVARRRASSRGVILATSLTLGLGVDLPPPRKLAKPHAALIAFEKPRVGRPRPS